MSTKSLLKSLENDQFITRDQAAELAKIALKEYTRRTKAAKLVDSRVWDMCLAGGCPNAVRSAVEELVDGYRCFAAWNPGGFANTWEVLVFDTPEARNSFTKENDAKPITKKDAARYATNYSATENREIKPRPFTDECWVIRDCSDVAGCVGAVMVGGPDEERLY